MTAKSIVIEGRDYCEVKLPDGLDAQAEQAAWQFLKNERDNKLSFINKSHIREKDKISLFYDPDNAVRWDFIYPEPVPLWNGIAGMIHSVYTYNNTEYDITVKIGSRFDEPGKNYFLSAMMLSWLDQNGLSFSEDTANISMEDIFHFLWVAIFKSQLIKSYETGIYKSYQYFEDNSDHIRGAIDVARHIRLNLGLNNGKIASKYRENTTDNFLNHLLIHTYLELKKLYPDIVSKVIDTDEHSRSIMQALMFQAPSYVKYDVRTVMSKLRNPISHPFFIHYEELRNTCFRILSYAGVSAFDRDDSEEETQCMLFYTPDLWEMYIENRIFPKFKEKVKWDSQLQDPELDLILGMRPDFVLKSNRGEVKKRIILDAKYKDAWKYFPDKCDLLKDDIRQCIVYKELFRAEYTGTIFPVRSTSVNDTCYRRSRRISKYDDPNESFLAFGVVIPKIEVNQTFQEWMAIMGEHESKTAGNIDEILGKLS